MAGYLKRLNAEPFRIEPLNKVNTEPRKMPAMFNLHKALTDTDFREIKVTRTPARVQTDTTCPSTHLEITVIKIMIQAVNLERLLQMGVGSFIN